MLNLKTHSTTHPIPSIPLTNQIQKPHTIITPFIQFQPTQTNTLSHYLQLKWRSKNTSKVNASSNNNNGADEDVRVRWGELVLDPDPDNVVAVGLTGALVWAGVQVLWHLFVVTMAVMIAAVKYTFVGVLLIFIVVTLL